jgi:hypothetical protein
MFYPKPQLQWKVDNRSVFVPKITNKPHYLRPLNISLDHTGEYCHPYESELMAFTPSFCFPPISLDKPLRDLTECNINWIDDPAQLEPMLTELSSHSVISVDLQVNLY